MLKASVDDLRFFRPGEEPIDTAAGIVEDGPSVVLLTDGPLPVRIVTAARDADRRTAARRGSRTPSAPAMRSVAASWPRGSAAGRGRADLADRDAIVDATSFAVRVASITCTRPGADPPTASELGAWAVRVGADDRDGPVA